MSLGDAAVSAFLQAVVPSGVPFLGHFAYQVISLCTCGALDRPVRRR
jgi:hypothetical protein